jgi:hypothetical protein
MPQAMEHIGSHRERGDADEPDANTGDSLTVRSFDQSKKAYLLNTVGVRHGRRASTEVHSPRMHDNVHAIHSRVVASQPLPLLPLGFPQRVYPTDVLTVQLAGDATAGRLQPLSLLLYYEDVPGSRARFMDTKTSPARSTSIMVETAITLAVDGRLLGERRDQRTSDFFIANTDYALLGYVPDISVNSIHWRGADIGNVRVGGPGTTGFRS